MFVRRPSRLPFQIIAASLLVLTTVAVAVAARSNKWWWDNLGGPSSAAFADLDQIKKSNVQQLDVAWNYPYASPGFNPIVVDDVVYTTGRNGSLIALDATSGKELWIHEDLTDMTGRGVNFWASEDGKDKRLIFWVNSFMQEIDAKSGKTIPTFGVDGIVDLRAGLRRGENMGWNLNSPGKIWKNELIIGSTTGEAFMSPPGDLRAFDVVTGKKLWQFHTIPEPGEFGFDTWPAQAYQYAGGVNNWGSMSVDEDRGIVFVPTGSSTYDFYGADRVGQDVYANCILALDARTGKRLWHFQTVHHDLWDLDNVSAPMLVTVMHNGQKIDAVAHAGKTGFLYAFNRLTGEPLWPMEERPVPPSDVPGESAWPTQPFVATPPPFIRQKFTVDDVNRWLLTPDEYQKMRDRVAKAKNGQGPQGGIFNPPGVGYDTISMPGNQGGSNWATTAADPQKGMMFVVGVNQVALLKLEDVTRRAAGRGEGGAYAGAAQHGRQVYQQLCSSCHGVNLQGGAAGAPSLVGVTNRMSDDAVRAIVTGGRGLMRPVSEATSTDLTDIIAFLASASPNGSARPATSEPSFPPGPVVARGGAPLPTLPPRNLGPFYPGIGGNAGNLAYPEGVSVPPNRYMSDYGVLASATNAPYTTLTAYDLNTGQIKWQVANGDHAPTVTAGGPHDTGGLGARNGMVVTKGGLVFHAGGDGKFRAYDEDTGKVLWTGAFSGSAPGMPVSYEAQGRQYVVMISGNGSNVDSEVAAAAPKTGPSGMTAYALKK